MSIYYQHQAGKKCITSNYYPESSPPVLSVFLILDHTVLRFGLSQELTQTFLFPRKLGERKKHIKLGKKSVTAYVGICVHFQPEKPFYHVNIRSYHNFPIYLVTLVSIIAPASAFGISLLEITHFPFALQFACLCFVPLCPSASCFSIFYLLSLPPFNLNDSVRSPTGQVLGKKTVILCSESKLPEASNQ